MVGLTYKIVKTVAIVPSTYHASKNMAPSFHSTIFGEFVWEANYFYKHWLRPMMRFFVTDRDNQSL